MFAFVRSLRAWFDDPARRACRKVPRRRLQLEFLDDRIVPATLTWNGVLGAPTNMSNPGNWVQNAVPQAGDSLVFDGNQTIVDATWDLGPLQLDSVEFTNGYAGTASIGATHVNTVTQSSGTAIFGTSSVNTYAQTGGDVHVIGWNTLTVNTMVATQLSGAGTIEVKDGNVPGALFVAGAPLTVDVQYLQINNNANFDVDAAVIVNAGAGLYQLGTMDWTAGSIIVNANGLLVNGGTMRMRATTNLDGLGVVSNYGLMTTVANAAGGGPVVTCNANVSNYSMAQGIEVPAGEIRLLGQAFGAIEAGRSSISAGSRLQWGNRAVSMATVYGPGTLAFEEGTTQVNGSLRVESNTATLHEASKLKGVGSATFTGNFDWFGGTIEDFSTGSLDIEGTFELLGADTMHLNNANIRRNSLTQFKGGTLELYGGSIENYAIAEFMEPTTIEGVGFYGGWIRNEASGFLAHQAIGETVEFKGTAVLQNYGRFTLNGNTLLFSDASTSGVVPFQQAYDGITTMCGGTIDVGGTNTLLIAGGQLDGWGVIDGNLELTGGTLQVGGGYTLHVVGDLDLGPGTELKVGYNGNSGTWGWINVALTATLDTTVQLSLFEENGQAPTLWADILIAGIELDACVLNLPAGPFEYSIVSGALQVRRKP